MTDSPTQATPFDRKELARLTGALAEHDLWIGTSSWKYPGWVGLVYSEEPYLWRGRFAETRFNRTCLEEYAQTFPSVCVDGAYYQFPREAYLEGLASQVPDAFRFSFKVTDEITIKHFPKLDRFGPRAGQPNDSFLNAALFEDRFLGPCASIREKIGLIMFEFSRFYPRDFERGREFVGALDTFLGKLPKGWSYGVEIRNKGFLKPDYFDMLQRYGVAHVFNSWDGMPGIDEQIELAGDGKEGVPIGARLLLKPGRKYQAAVDRFQPYKRLQEVVDSARRGAQQLVQSAIRRKAPLYLYGNNRLEGCAPMTLQAILHQLPPAVWEDLRIPPPGKDG